MDNGLGKSCLYCLSLSKRRRGWKHELLQTGGMIYMPLSAQFGATNNDLSEALRKER